MIDALRSSPVFAGLPEETLERLAAVASEVEFPAGQVLIEHDAPASGLYVILEGRVAIHAPDEDLERGPGEVVGERALASGGTRTGRVSAVTQVRLLSIAREHVEPEVAEHLSRPR
jgi:CRP-like cAMP-binding protein